MPTNPKRPKCGVTRGDTAIVDREDQARELAHTRRV